MNGPDPFTELRADAEAYERGEPMGAPSPRIPVLDFDRAANAPILPELVDGLLPERGLAYVYGASGAGKSYLTADVALHVACGRPWRGREVRPGSVAYVAAEAQASFGRRLRAWRTERLGDEAEAPPFYVVPAALDLFDPAADTGALIEALRALPQPLRLVVVDTLARSIGAGDENAAKDMGLLVGNLDRIGRETGALVLVVHHSGKDESKGARGSGALRAAADTEIHVEAKGRRRTATVSKQRDGEDGQVYPFTLKVVEIGEKPNGTPLTSCVVEHEDAEEGAGKGQRPTGQAAFALQQLHNCLAEQGYPAKGGTGQPGQVTVVRVEAWRARCYAAGMGGADNPESRSRAFRRAYNNLLEMHAIVVRNEEVWAL